MHGYSVDLERETLENENYRRVLYTGPNSQLVLMNLEPGVEIGEEVHAEHDQFVRIEKGEGKAVLDGEETALHDGSAVLVPAGTRHNFINTSETEPMKLYTIYAPPEHPDGTVQRTKADSLEE